MAYAQDRKSIADRKRQVFDTFANQLFEGDISDHSGLLFVYNALYACTHYFK